MEYDINEVMKQNTQKIIFLTIVFLLPFCLFLLNSNKAQAQAPTCSAWSGPTTLTGFPGTGSLQADNEEMGCSMSGSCFVHQVIWRNNQIYNRDVPIVNEVPNYNDLGGQQWSAPVDLSGYNLPNTGEFQAFSYFTIRNGSQMNSWTIVWRGDKEYIQTFQNSYWADPILISSLPGSGSMQAFDGFIIGSTLWQSFWRGDQNFSRTVPINNSSPNWAAASAWSNPSLLSSIPGTSSVQTKSGFVIGNKLWESYWRADQRFTRTVPIINEVPDWSSCPSGNITSTPTPTTTPNLNCLCKSDNSCDSSCSFTKWPGVSYNNPIKCSLSANLFMSIPSDANKTSWCTNSGRTKGDADGLNDNNQVDYDYYIQAIIGGKIPASVNPDFDGDGVVGDSDREIIMRYIASTDNF